MFMSSTEAEYIALGPLTSHAAGLPSFRGALHAVHHGNKGSAPSSVILRKDRRERSSLSQKLQLRRGGYVKSQGSTREEQSG